MRPEICDVRLGVFIGRTGMPDIFIQFYTKSLKNVFFFVFFYWNFFYWKRHLRKKLNVVLGAGLWKSYAHPCNQCKKLVGSQESQIELEAWCINAFSLSITSITLQISLMNDTLVDILAPNSLQIGCKKGI